jgi:hypothetical protein
VEWPASGAGVLHEWVVEGQNGQVAIFCSANYFVRNTPNSLHSGTEGVLAIGTGGDTRAKGAGPDRAAGTSGDTG